jgi:hypothetical protein
VTEEKGNFGITGPEGNGNRRARVSEGARVKPYFRVYYLASLLLIFE